MGKVECVHLRGGLCNLHASRARLVDLAAKLPNHRKFQAFAFSRDMESRLDWSESWTAVSFLDDGGIQFQCLRAHGSRVGADSRQ
jgi:hypothetical protein